ncbi:MAG: Hsp20/alpha crystallin family protein [Candidatus Promineifilaceae bacterium]|nr:Hsp20/alpha crystallin family protein [Candidatus Promineifilaceae bacterium]
MFRDPVNWRDINRLRRDMDRLFESSLPRWSRSRSPKFPAINVWTSDEEGIYVTAELPGVSPDDLDISVTADTLVLNGTRKTDETDESTRYHRRERMYGEFSRSFQLPFTVNSEKVDARIQHGVLQIFLPRAESEKPKQITVQTNS